jgi:hypothetical protein
VLSSVGMGWIGLVCYGFSSFVLGSVRLDQVNLG